MIDVTHAVDFEMLEEDVANIYSDTEVASTWTERLVGALDIKYCANFFKSVESVLDSVCTERSELTHKYAVLGSKKRLKEIISCQYKSVT